MGGGVGEGVEVRIVCTCNCGSVSIVVGDVFFFSSSHRFEQSARTAGPAAVSPPLRNPLVTCTQLPVQERHLALKPTLWSKHLKFTTILRYTDYDK